MRLCKLWGREITKCIFHHIGVTAALDGIAAVTFSFLVFARAIIHVMDGQDQVTVYQGCVHSV